MQNKLFWFSSVLQMMSKLKFWLTIGSCNESKLFQTFIFLQSRTSVVILLSWLILPFIADFALFNSFSSFCHESLTQLHNNNSSSNNNTTTVEDHLNNALIRKNWSSLNSKLNWNFNKIKYHWKFTYKISICKKYGEYTLKAA